jgi:hypothetical protein
MSGEYHTLKNNFDGKLAEYMVSHLTKQMGCQQLLLMYLDHTFHYRRFFEKSCAHIWNQNMNMMVGSFILLCYNLL